ncbi:MAG: hypothetical protein E7626_01535 [Ruminococcaceae bacterium]|nr:hypothetical protein [Oscillospiraceae bacterium]
MKKYLRILAFILALLALPFQFASCSRRSKVVLELDGHEISEGMYSYWMNNWKDYFLTYYSDVKDTPEYWASLNDTGVTNEEYISSQIETRIRFYLVGMVLFDELGLELSDEAEKSIKDTVNEQIAHYESRSEYTKMLKEDYGITLKEMKAVFRAEEQYNAVLKYLYDDTSGVETATADELEAYYNTYYARVKYVMFLKNVRYVYNDDGTRKTDSTGRYLTEELSDSEKDEVVSKAQSVYAEALGGADMNALMEKYMKEFGFDLASTPNGFYVSADDYLSHSAAVTSAALEMEVGEVKLCENDDCYYVVKKLELPEKGYASPTDSGQFKNFVSYVNNEKLSKKFSQRAEGIKENTEITDKYILSKI